MADDKAQLDGFLGKVDEIENLIKGLANADEDGISKADEYLAKLEPKKKFPPTDNTGVNKTLINKDAFKEHTPQNPASAQDSFMKSVEVDAKERTERRKENEKKAIRIKEIANEHFKRGDYEKALHLYTQAIDLVRDMSVLYTNRAQTLIKLLRYEEALTDCDWALRAFPNSLKAYIHRGRAFVALNKFTEAEESFNEAMKINPSKSNAIKGYLRDVELARRTAQEENEAAQLFESGEATGLVEVLNRLSQTDQLPVYYAGGFTLLSSLILNVSDQTLFRTHGGLTLAHTHPVLSKYISVDVKSLASDELQVCCAYVEVLQAALLNNEENQVQLMSTDGFAHQLLRWMEDDQLRPQLLRVLLVTSQTEIGRSKVTRYMDLSGLLNVLLNLMKSNLATDAVRLMNNLAMDSRFRKHLRNNSQEGVLVALEEIMSAEMTVEPGVLAVTISTLSNLCADAAIRRQLAERSSCWDACTCTLQKNHLCDTEWHRDIVHSNLGLIMNLTFDSHANAGSFTAPICETIIGMLQNVVVESSLEQRSLSCLSRLLAISSQDTVDRCVDLHLLRDVLLPRLKHLHDNSILASVVKSLVACTRCSVEARTLLCSHTNGIERMTELLWHDDDGIVGNAALCLSHCVSSSFSSDRDVIKQLLILTRDQNRASVRQNCAILCAKLCQQHSSHLERLRQLHGIEILHDAIQHEKMLGL